MAAGFLTAIVWVVAFKERVYDLYEMWPGFAAGFAATILVSIATARSDGAGDAAPLASPERVPAHRTPPRARR